MSYIQYYPMCAYQKISSAVGEEMCNTPHSLEICYALPIKLK